MAFVKRTWLARIGTGLNKFIIGDKDANNKQTLTNSPDSVTQEGDVISADNLNDLESRIEAGMNSMKLTKVWENPDPDETFEDKSVILNSKVTDVVIEFLLERRYFTTIFLHVRYDETMQYNTDFSVSTMYINEDVSSIGWRTRKFTMTVGANSTTFAFGNCRTVSGSGSPPTFSWLTTNSMLIPYRIYSVGDSYNS